MISAFKFIMLTIAPVVARLICSIFFKEKTTGKQYAFIFVLSFIMVLFYTCALDAAPHRNKWSKSFVLNSEQTKEYTDKKVFHKFHAERTYADAKSLCWYLPSRTHRDAARDCFATTTSTLGILFCSGDARSKAIATLVVNLTWYGLACLDEWETIHNKLYWCEYHWEMYEWYDHVLKNG